ncbi:MAG: aminopeptidase P family N-terminal domain-containing protein [Holdemanella porci]
MFQKRVDQVIAKMKADGLKQILVSEPCSIYYLTGVDEVQEKDCLRYT